MRDHVHGSGRHALGIGGVVVVEATPIGVVVALQHQVHIMFFENRLPRVTDAALIASITGVVDRLVEHDDGPRIGVVRQRLIQPRRLLIDLLVSVEHHDPHVIAVHVVVALIVQAVRGQRVVLVVVGGRYLRKIPEVSRRVVLVVTRGEQVLTRGGVITQGTEPVVPLRMVVGDVDHVARVKNQARIGVVLERHPGILGPLLGQSLLCITEVEEVESVAGVGGGEGMPLAGVLPADHAELVGGAGFEPLDVGTPRIMQVGHVGATGGRQGLQHVSGSGLTHLDGGF